MIKVFSGRWRGLGDNQNGLGMLLDFKFRGIIHLFNGAKLHVFIAIALHSDENGIACPSYDLLEAETGYTRGTIATALNELCEMEIDGQKVLARFRSRDEAGQFAGNNFYLIFPNAEELADAQSIVFPTTDKSNYGKPILKVKPSPKVKPVSSPPKTTSSFPVSDLEHLETVFAKERGVPCPNWKVDPKGCQTTWRTPLKEIRLACPSLQHAEQIVITAVRKMKEDKLTFTKPIQILEVTLSLIADKKANASTQPERINYTQLRIQREAQEANHV